MKQLLFVIAFLSAAIICQSQNIKVFEELNQLKGLWKMESEKGAMYEEWKIANDTLLEGRSYKLNDKDTMLLETVKLSNSADGIFYTVIVEGQPAVPFKLINSGNNSYTFENEANEFPQRIIYKLIGQDKIHARIEGDYQGKETSSDFNFIRIK